MIRHIVFKFLKTSTKEKSYNDCVEQERHYDQKDKVKDGCTFIIGNNTHEKRVMEYL